MIFNKLQEFHNCDCLLMMKEYPDKFFDLAVVDPPYGINVTKMSMGTNKTRKDNGYPGESTAQRIRKGRLNSGAGKLKTRALNTLDCDWDFEKPSKEYFDELFRVSKNQIIFGGNYFELPPTRCWYIWDKIQPWENFSQAELAWTSFDYPIKIFRYSNTGGRNLEKKINATQKPIEVYVDILKRFANKGDIILDTHVGSASSLIACHMLSYEYVGYEISESQYIEAKERLENEKAQISFEDFIGEHI